MKKTLFAVAALALCGTAFAETYNTSAYNDGAVFVKDNPFAEGESVTLNVNKTVTFSDFKANGAYLTLNFCGENTISCSGPTSLTGKSYVAITGDAAAKAYWGEQLTSSTGELKIIALVTAPSPQYGPQFNIPIYFEGLASSGPITLGNANLTYKGYKNGIYTSSLETFLNSINDGEVALVSVPSAAACQLGFDSKGLYLVGKVAAPVPEPATATLSLLALAGLASRRRRK